MAAVQNLHEAGHELPLHVPWFATNANLMSGDPALALDTSDFVLLEWRRVPASRPPDILLNPWMVFSNEVL